jgi:uncharacterized protein (DUF305 family)
MRQMDKRHGCEYTGDSDIDLARSMIPHHHGALDMCKVQLQYGRDAEIRELCTDIAGSWEK